MTKNREPTTKLSTVRIWWGITAVILLPTSLLQFVMENIPLGSFQLLAAAFTGWYAIRPPAYIRKKLIE